jgi:hypothetical protein
MRWKTFKLLLLKTNVDCHNNTTASSSVPLILKTNFVRPFSSFLLLVPTTFIIGGWPMAFRLLDQSRALRAPGGRTRQGTQSADATAVSSFQWISGGKIWRQFRFRLEAAKTIPTIALKLI